jgi:hypothetical protein
MFVSVWAPLKWLATGWTLSSIPDSGRTLFLRHHVQASCVFREASCPVVAECPSVWQQKDDITLTLFVVLVLYAYSFLLASCSRRPYLFTISAHYFITHSINCFTFFWQAHFPSTSPYPRPAKHPACHLFLQFFCMSIPDKIYFLFSAKYLLCVSLFLFFISSDFRWIFPNTLLRLIITKVETIFQLERFILWYIKLLCYFLYIEIGL